jgi:hypothetical protein
MLDWNLKEWESMNENNNVNCINIDGEDDVKYTMH